LARYHGGFTAPEVEVLAAHVGRADKVAEMAEWYDGNRFGKVGVCNPWSGLNMPGLQDRRYRG